MNTIISKGSKFDMVASTNPRTMEVLRVTKQGFEARDVKHSGKDLMHTGYQWFGIVAFRANLKAGYIAMKEAA